MFKSERSLLLDRRKEDKEFDNPDCIPKLSDIKKTAEKQEIIPDHRVATEKDLA